MSVSKSDPARPAQASPAHPAPSEVVVGVILLDAGYPEVERACTPDDAGLTSLPPGFLDNPASWSTPTVFRVAGGLDAQTSASGSDAAGEALRAAAEALDGKVDFLTTDCAWTWFRREDVRGVRVPKLLSSIALLDLAREIGEDVLIVAQSEPTLRALLDPVPAGVRVVGLEDKPEWQRFLSYTPELSPPLDQSLMGDQVVERLQAEFEAHGAPDVLLLECTGIHQFRDRIRAVYRGPLLDQSSFVRYALS
jgi:hypothetical protein